jgi:hypothetical protein
LETAYGPALADGFIHNSHANIPHIFRQQIRLVYRKCLKFARILFMKTGLFYS